MVAKVLHIVAKVLEGVVTLPMKDYSISSYMGIW